LDSTLGNRHERRPVVSQEGFKQGDEVEWNTLQGKTRGPLKRLIAWRDEYWQRNMKRAAS
jgi:hypothetical protein